MTATMMGRTLKTLSNSTKIGVISFNDEAAYGALQAARKAGRESDLVIVGQGADRLIHDEIRNPDSRIIGSTAYMPEKYGQQLLDISLRILNGESVPPALYIEQVFIDKSNIDLYYPLTE